MDIKAINEPLIASIDDEISSCMESMKNMSPTSEEYKDSKEAIVTLIELREKLVNEIQDHEAQCKKLEIEREIGTKRNEIEERNGKTANALSAAGVGASIVFALVGTFAEETRVIGTRASDMARKLFGDAKASINNMFNKNK